MELPHVQSVVHLQIEDFPARIWSDYSDRTQPRPKKLLRKGNPLNFREIYIDWWNIIPFDHLARRIMWPFGSGSEFFLLILVVTFLKFTSWPFQFRGQSVLSLPFLSGDQANDPGLLLGYVWFQLVRGDCCRTCWKFFIDIWEWTPCCSYHVGKW